MAAQAGFVLDMVRWETHVSPGMGRPQQVVFDQLGPIDIFVGVMWKHFGTSTGVAGSGTEEEFNQALASFQQTGRPRMLCYFSRASIEPPAVCCSVSWRRRAKRRKNCSALSGKRRLTVCASRPKCSGACR